MDTSGSALSSLLEDIGDSRFVLIGESTHGTSEFYTLRMELTKLLIEQKGFTIVAIEGDWSAATRANRYIESPGSGLGTSDVDAHAALGDFSEFPSWMWANECMVEFIDYLKKRNATKLNAVDDVRLVGMDLYSLGKSQQAVINFLEIVDPDRVMEVREAYRDLWEFHNDPHAYGREASIGELRSKVKQIQEGLANVLTMLQFNNQEAPSYSILGMWEQLNAEQNAEVVCNGEEYYRMFWDWDYGGSVVTWNTRDQHFVQTLMRIDRFYSQGRCSAKMVIWAHNSHVGDASATKVGQYRMNLGQMMRQTFGTDAVFVCTLSTALGTVTAAPSRGKPAECFTLNEPLQGSYDDIFSKAFGALHHEDRTRADGFVLSRRNKTLCKCLGDTCDLQVSLSAWRPYRFVGVCYKPSSETKSHYIETNFAQHSDAHIFVYRTQALKASRVSVVDNLTPARPPRQHQQSEACSLPSEDQQQIEIGCKCGFSCGTRKALDKHLSRFPGDASHEPCIKYASGSPMD